MAECLRMPNADFILVPEDESVFMGYSDGTKKCVCTTFGNTEVGADKTNDWLVATILSWFTTFAFWEPGTVVFKAFLVGIVLKKFEHTAFGVFVGSVVEVMGAFLGGGMDNVGNGAGDIAAAAGAGEMDDDKAHGQKETGEKMDLEDLSEAVFSGHFKHAIKPTPKPKKPKQFKSLLSGNKYQVAVEAPDDKEEEKTDDPIDEGSSFVSFDAKAEAQIHSLTPRREAKAKGPPNDMFVGGPGAGAVDAITGAPYAPPAINVANIESSQVQQGANDPVVGLKGPPTPTAANVIQKGAGGPAKGPSVSMLNEAATPASRGPPANLMAAGTTAVPPAAKGPPVGLMKKAAGASAASSSPPKVRGPSVNLMKSATAKKQASPEALAPKSD